jgi:hypothetical protein
MAKNSEIFQCRKLPFQVGDAVKTPAGVRIITAIGLQLRTKSVVYRVGRNQYWHGWQISMAGTK